MKRFLFILLFTLAIASCMRAADVRLAWDPSPSQGVTGYRIYFGKASGSYGEPVAIGNVTTYTVKNLGAGTYYFAVTAFDGDGNESGFSNEVSTLLKLDPPANLQIIEVIVHENGAVTARSVTPEEYRQIADKSSQNQ